MVSLQEVETFHSRGVILLKNFLPDSKVNKARQAIFRHFENEGIWRDGAWHLDEILPNAGTKLVKRLDPRRELGDLIGEAVRWAIEDLLDGREVFPLLDCVQVLFTLPNAAQWTVPHQLWHLDLPRMPDCGIMGVQIFSFLDTVVPGGGGTLVVAGSHRLVNENQRLSSQQVKKILKREPYFRDLMSGDLPDRERFLREPGRVGEVALQVVELCGEPGDVFFTDLRLLHTIAPNASQSPRIMLTQRFLLETFREPLYGPSDTAESP